MSLLFNLSKFFVANYDYFFGILKMFRAILIISAAYVLIVRVHI